MPQNKYETTPKTKKLISKIYKKYLGRIVPCTEALPPEKIDCICYVEGRREEKENQRGYSVIRPYIGYLKFAAGDKAYPYFVVPGCPYDKWIVLAWYALEANGIPEKYSGTEEEIENADG